MSSSMTAPTSARARTRLSLQALALRFRTRRPPLPIDVGALHALRDFGAECYALGFADAHARSTVPARAPGDDEDTGKYSIMHPLADEEEHG